MKSRGLGWVIGQLMLLGVVAIVAPCYRSAKTPGFAVASGALLLLYAGSVLLIGARTLGSNLTPLPAPRANGELVTNGIFARVRHPLYSGLMAFGFGWTLLWGSYVAIGPAIALATYLHFKALHEEQMLGARFPGYTSYAAHVPRYLPRLI
jgi:protein-S-isoprenylcysteine O-methyltransferase Ste14